MSGMRSAFEAPPRRACRAAPEGSRALAAALAVAAAAALIGSHSMPARAADLPRAAAGEDPALEAHVLRIAAELRCLVCQNQTVAESDADLAVDLREVVRQSLRRGLSEAEIYAYMTERYGDFVRYRPPLDARTLLLWGAPVLSLGGGAGVLLMLLRRRGRMAADHFDADIEEAPLQSTADASREARSL